MTTPSAHHAAAAAAAAPAVGTTPAPVRPLPAHSALRDLGTTLAALAALLVWDASGTDLAVTRLFASAQGFALRDSVWTATLAHDGGRLLAWALLGALVVAAIRAPASGMAGMAGHAGVAGVPATPSRAERWRWLGVMLLCVLAVPLLKRFSATSCPWDLAEFGGQALYVSHWALARFDGGPGHCFPSGHAVAGGSPTTRPATCCAG